MDFHPMPRYLMRKHAIKKILKKYLCKNKDLLEIGYGAGEIFSTYLQWGINCYGYDFSEEAYNYVMANTKNNADNITLYKMEDEIQNRKYDFIIACEVLEHIENDEEALLNWKSDLNRDGMLLISVPAHQGSWDYDDIVSGHFRRYEKSELTELLERSGFRIEFFWTYNFPACIILDPIRINHAKKTYSLNKSVEKEEYTKISGINRSKNRLFRLLSNKYFLYPLMKFQELFYKSDLGTAYIVACMLKTED